MDTRMQSAFVEQMIMTTCMWVCLRIRVSDGQIHCHQLLCLTTIFIRRMVNVHIFKCFAQALKDDLKCKVIFMLENDAVLL